MAEEKVGLVKVSLESVVKSQEYVLEWESEGAPTFVKYLTRGPLYADIRSLTRLEMNFSVSRTITEQFQVRVE